MNKNSALHITKTMLTKLPLLLFVLHPAICFSAEEVNRTFNKVLPITASGEISPVMLYEQADSVGRAVMLGLAVLSILCWAILIVKFCHLWSARRKLNADLFIISDARATDAAVLDKIGQTSKQLITGVVNELRSRDKGETDEQIRERITSRLFFYEARKVRDLSRGTGLLATISAVAPFIGLFGTVWGIMHSFLSLAQSSVTNINIIAPSIAESLYATALGLAVAIPAVIFYNFLSRFVNDYQMLLHEVSTVIRDYAESSKTSEMIGVK